MPSLLDFRLPICNSTWRGHLALVPYRRQDAGGTQGRDGLATNGNLFKAENPIQARI